MLLKRVSPLYNQLWSMPSPLTTIQSQNHSAIVLIKFLYVRCYSDNHWLPGCCGNSEVSSLNYYASGLSQHIILFFELMYDIKSNYLRAPSYSCSPRNPHCSDNHFPSHATTLSPYFSDFNAFLFLSLSLSHNLPRVSCVNSQTCKYQGTLNSIFSIIASLGAIAGPVWMGFSVGDIPTVRSHEIVAPVFFGGVFAICIVTFLVNLVVIHWKFRPIEKYYSF